MIYSQDGKVDLFDDDRDYASQDFGTGLPLSQNREFLKPREERVLMPNLNGGYSVYSSSTVSKMAKEKQ